ncbi:MAG: hypothetical protein ACC608_03110 [Anaerofustis sp.]
MGLAKYYEDDLNIFNERIDSDKDRLNIHKAIDPMNELKILSSYKGNYYENYLRKCNFNIFNKFI